MLSLQLKSGEYLTIGDDIAVQVFKQSGPVFRVQVKAPREIPILRGDLRERSGSERPDGLLDRQPVAPSRRRHNAKNSGEMAQRRAIRAGALEEMSHILDRLDKETNQAAVREGLLELRTHLGQVRELCGAERNS